MKIDLSRLKAAYQEVKEFLYDKIFRYKLVVRILAALLIAAAMAGVYQLDLFDRLEYLTVDYRFKLRHAPGADPSIVFIEMAEDSIGRLGGWPWPRRYHGGLLAALAPHLPKEIAFDVLFSEPQDEKNDGYFEVGIRQAGNVYLPLMYELGRGGTRAIWRGEDVQAVYRPIPRFARWIKGTGHINALPDSDGVFRRVYPIIEHGGTRVYQLGFKLACDYLGIAEKDIVFLPAKHRIELRRPDGKVTRIPLDDGNRLIVNWQNKWEKEAQHYSYYEILASAKLEAGEEPMVDLNAFRGKICIVGLTALGLMDIKPIPLEGAYPAVGVHKMVASSIIRNDFIGVTHRPVNTIIIFIIAGLFTFFLLGLRPLGGLAAAIVGITGYFALSAAIFGIFGLLIVTFYPLFGIFVAYILTAAYTQILQSVERARLFRQATRDGLTGLYNVRHFNLLIEAELRNVALHKGRKLSIIMFDIDNFKKLNDTHGHQAGDQILREFAKAIQGRCRQTDIVARYGGEEFIILLVGAAQKEAADVAEKIRETLAAKKFKFGEVVYSTSVSIGCVEWSCEKTREEIVEKADKALYAAKHAGKNRVMVYDPSMEANPTK